MAVGIDEDKIIQYEGEEIPWAVEMTKVGSSSGSMSTPTFSVFDLPDENDLTSTVTSGSPSVQGQFLITPILHSLSEEKEYLGVFYFYKDGNKLRQEVPIYCPEAIGS